MIEKKDTWYADWFNEIYLKIYAHRDVSMAESEIAFAIDKLCLEPEDTVLDLCSGAGRHLAQLQRRGFRNAVGMDLSPTLLQVAKEALDNPRVLVRGDMRHLPFSTRFDAVLCLFTSFGYFLDEEENVRVLREIRRVLRPNGYVLLDLLSHTVAERLVPKSERTVDGAHVVETRRYDAAAKRIEKEISISGPEGNHEFVESVRVYSFKEIGRLFADAGLALAAVHGSFQGAEYHASSERMIVAGVRLEVPPSMAKDPLTPPGTA
jgi:SAM-dependent methyltransferase